MAVQRKNVISMSEHEMEGKELLRYVYRKHQFSANNNNAKKGNTVV